jgi:16S rRNA G966 N2-methylase RsmD
MIETNIKQKLFSDIDLKKSLDDPEFKEDSVREVIILPILKELGYKQENIVRSKTLQHPFLKLGSNKKIPIKLVPDYILKVENNYAWVLDAKAPDKNLNDDDYIQQVYSYASHQEVRSAYFALCNGKELVLYRTESNKPTLKVDILEIDQEWDKLKMFLSPDSFQLGKNIVYERVFANKKETFDYSTRPLLDDIPVKKQQAKRHFGVHGYFTKQSWNVVADYIKNYSKIGDLVLDPFGGSGVTAIEALMNNRRAINIDLNPMAVFLVESLVVPVNLSELSESFISIKKEYEKRDPKDDNGYDEILKKYSYPKGLFLPKSSDVDTVEKLFSKEQLARLALLKSLILKEKNESIRKSLLLMFSGLLTKTNLTYHNNPNRPADGQGNAAVFAYYRYRIAPNPVNIDIMKYFELRYKKVVEAKKEMEYFINKDTFPYLKILKGTATDLSFIPKESVDYIYTDPPYGKKIPYLDLSIMWNAWLDLEVTKEDYEMEAIEGGENHKSKDEYNYLISQSIKEMYRVLKYDRWMSFVFAHKDPEFWHLIIETAEACGFEYVGAVPQKKRTDKLQEKAESFYGSFRSAYNQFQKGKKPESGAQSKSRYGYC